MNRVYSPSVRLALLLFATAMLLPLTGCTRYKTWYTNDFRPVERPRDREVPMYSREGPIVGLEFGKIQSRRYKKKSEKHVAKQLQDIQRAAQKMNADAVWNIRILPVKKTGFTSDPNTPFPSIMGDDWLEYILVGSAMVYPLREEILRVELGWDDAAQTEEEEISETEPSDSPREPEVAEETGAVDEPQQVTPAQIIAEDNE